MIGAGFDHGVGRIAQQHEQVDNVLPAGIHARQSVKPLPDAAGEPAVIG